MLQWDDDRCEIEVDTMMIFGTVPKEASWAIEPVSGKLGFIRLLHEPAGYSYVYNNGVIPRTHDCIYHGKYICPMRCKEVTLIQSNRGSPGIFTSLNMTETTLDTASDFGSLCIHRDHVPSFHLLSWPHEASAWISRHRHWPQQQTIQSIADKGCHIVPRSSLGGDIHSEWRLSFSMSETTLAQLRSKEHHRAYRFFKMLFYRYLKGVQSSEPERKSMFSYLIKTTMLWVCEDLPPEDSVWTSLEASVQVLLCTLQGGLQKGVIRHYFIPEINLLERVGADVRRKCSAVISCIQRNILMAAPFEMWKKCKDDHSECLCSHTRTDQTNFLRHVQQITDLVMDDPLFDMCIFPDMKKITVMQECYAFMISVIYQLQFCNSYFVLLATLYQMQIETTKGCRDEEYGDDSNDSK